MQRNHPRWESVAARQPALYGRIAGKIPAVRLEQDAPHEWYCSCVVRLVPRRQIDWWLPLHFANAGEAKAKAKPS